VGGFAVVAGASDETRVSPQFSKNMITAYVAGSMLAIAEIKRRVADLEARCFTVLSSWHTRDESRESMLEIATKDWLELMRSQMVIVNADTPSSSGGYFVETGAAIAYEKPVVYITGEKGTVNVFAYLPSVSIYPSWQKYLDALDSRNSSVRAAHVANTVPSTVARADEQQP